MTNDARYLNVAAFDALLRSLAADGYELIGPTLRDDVIVFDGIQGVADLPRGVHETHAAGRYRTETTDDPRSFAWAHGPDSAKGFLFPARERLAEIRRNGGMRAAPAAEAPRYAFVGLRSCDLHAISVQDRVFLGLDPAYRARREAAFLIGLNCAEPGETCFCVSMGTGPRCTAAYDLALTELEGGYLVEVGSERGRRSLTGIDARAATDEEVERSRAIIDRAAARMGRAVDASDLHDLLIRNREHPRWAAVAERCLACTNCTAVCPTCFCHDVVDGVSLSGDVATRTREWASCFSAEFSLTAGATVREARSERYRQWLTHKFATWIDQFGTSGCVGCGRCITWCPVGIDVVDELSAIRASDGAREGVAS
jgi:ferredoxin